MHTSVDSSSYNTRGALSSSSLSLPISGIGSPTVMGNSFDSKLKIITGTYTIVTLIWYPSVKMDFWMS